MPSKPNPVYLLDTNVLINSWFLHYKIDFFPGYWDALLLHHKRKRIFSIVNVKDEFKPKAAEAKAWVDAADKMGFFLNTDEDKCSETFDKIMNWAYRAGRPVDVVDSWSEVADPWLIAFAKVNGHTVVTFETKQPDDLTKIKIPDVCEEFEVPCVKPNAMLSELGIRLVMDGTQR